MDRLLLAVDKLLTALPFDGHKTTLGLVIKFGLQLLISVRPELSLLAYTPVVDQVADGLIALGAAHKSVKEARKDVKPSVNLREINGVIKVVK